MHLPFSWASSRGTIFKIQLQVLCCPSKDDLLNFEGQCQLPKPDFENPSEKDHAMKSTIASVSMETRVQRGCLPGEVCLFYFFKLLRITLWDVTFCFHKRTQGVRQSLILYSLKIECAVVFAGLFNMSLSTNFMYKWVTVPWKYSEKEETVSKRSIKYYYIESHAEWKTFPPNLQSFRGARDQHVCIKWESPISTNQRSERSSVKLAINLLSSEIVPGLVTGSWSHFQRRPWSPVLGGTCFSSPSNRIAGHTYSNPRPGLHTCGECTPWGWLRVLAFGVFQK